MPQTSHDLYRYMLRREQEYQDAQTILLQAKQNLAAAERLVEDREQDFIGANNAWLCAIQSKQRFPEAYESRNV